MTNTGKASRGCHRCRARRVKCDLEQPQCQRCLSLGQPCPGYRKESDLVFRNQDQSTYLDSSSKDHRKTNQKGSSEPLPDHNELLSISDALLNSMKDRIAIFDRIIFDHASKLEIPPDDWEEHAIPFIISQFSAPTRFEGRFFGFMESFPKMIAETKEASPLLLCCKAVAFMYFENRSTTVQEQAPRSAAAYGKALNATQTALSDSGPYPKNEILVSIWLLSIYETLCGASMSLQCPGRPPTWNMHILGLTTLLRLQDHRQCLSGNSRRFFWMVMCLMESRCLAAGVECPQELIKWLEENILDFVSEELDLHHTLVHGYHASVWCAEVRKTVVTGGLLEPILTLLEKGRKLGRETEANLPRDFRSPHQPLRQTHIYNFQRAVRVHIHYSILELLGSDMARSDPQLTPKLLQKEQNHSISLIQSLAQNIISTIPTVIGPASSEHEGELERLRCWSDALRLLWPLRVLASRQVISNEQREVVEKTLQRLDTDFCMRAATAPYAIPKKLQFRKSEAVEKSQRCKTCKRRKVKCDEERPLCQRCRTSQMKCEGYEDSSRTSREVQDSRGDHGLIGRIEESIVVQ